MKTIYGTCKGKKVGLTVPDDFTDGPGTAFDSKGKVYKIAPGLKLTPVKNPRCMYFANCTSKATTTVLIPILGGHVPCCQKCADFYNR